MLPLVVAYLNHARSCQKFLIRHRLVQPPWFRHKLTAVAKQDGFVRSHDHDLANQAASLSQQLAFVARSNDSALVTGIYHIQH